MWGSRLARAWEVARAALAAERARPTPRRRVGHELEFLPAALEVMDTPASPLPRALAILLVALFVIALVWSWVGRVDVVAVAPGKIIPSGKVKVIQPFASGVVKSIRVRDGQHVRRGELLIELDPTTTAADRERLSRELAAARIDAERLRAALDHGSGATAFQSLPGLDPSLVAMHRSLLNALVQEHEARLASLDREIARKTWDRASIEAQVAKLEQTVPLVRERAESHKALVQEGAVGRLAYLELQQQLIEHEQDLTAQRHRLSETGAAIASLEEQRRKAEAEFRRTALDKLTEASTRAASLGQELVKAEQRDRLQRLTAPIDGVVQQLAVHTVGGVVTPAQTLMIVVPARSPLEVEARVLNRDAGFVRAGQEAELKLETFLFTKYGTIPGKVLDISRDATQDEKLGLVYVARISMARTAMDVDGKSVPVTPGMAVTAEITTDRRRVIEYLLSPLLRYRQESLRER
jgi:hemolysin D